MPNYINVPKTISITEKTILLDQKLRKEYLKCIARSSKLSHVKLLKKAKAGLLRQRVTIQLTKGNARKLWSLAGKKEIEVIEMADEVLSSYLKRK